MTKKLNKKGTSLVELIAVIVIMGIIAGIAIPTTIAVINRQKKNSAEKSVEAVVSTMKNLLSEAQVHANSGSVCLEVTFGANGVIAANGIKVYDGANNSGTDITTSTGFTAADMTVDNFKGDGTLTGVLDASGTKINGTISNVSGYAVTVTNNVCRAGSNTTSA